MEGGWKGEEGEWQRARRRIILYSRQAKPLIVAAFIVRNRRFTFAIRHSAILQAILMSTATLGIRRPRWEDARSRAVRRECIIYECIRRNSIRSGIKSGAFPTISFTFLLAHFENFAVGSTREKRRRGRCKVHSSQMTFRIDGWKDTFRMLLFQDGNSRIGCTRENFSTRSHDFHIIFIPLDCSFDRPDLSAYCLHQHIHNHNHKFI